MLDVEQVYHEIFASLSNQRKAEFFQQQNNNININNDIVNKSDKKSNI